MNTWQFLVELIPETGLVRQFGKIPEKLNEADYDTSNSSDNSQDNDQPEYWKGFLNQEELVTSLCGILEERKSWSPQVRLFGTKGTDEIEIWMTDNWNLMEIMIAFNSSHPNPQFIHKCFSIARSFQLVLKSIRTHEVFRPTVEDFVVHAEKCRSSRFLPQNTRLIDLLSK